jgi:predicted  nucleic acid-binding Zn-ribbon protein
MTGRDLFAQNPQALVATLDKIAEGHAPTERQAKARAVLEQLAALQMEHTAYVERARVLRQELAAVQEALAAKQAEIRDVDNSAAQVEAAAARIEVEDDVRPLLAGLVEFRQSVLRSVEQLGV